MKSASSSLIKQQLRRTWFGDSKSSEAANSSRYIPLFSSLSLFFYYLGWLRFVINIPPKNKVSLNLERLRDEKEQPLATSAPASHPPRSAHLPNFDPDFWTRAATWETAKTLPCSTKPQPWNVIASQPTTSPSTLPRSCLSLSTVDKFPVVLRNTIPA
ncbi:hypothetical protein VTJ49DRAFT_1169 [Mycothermus thermophilus]|uniref:Uncharacterized protein n=1 Tax=Humicola insolens TaxID=85995 RepID=A0ABR3VD90_HUMIN